MNSPVRRYTLWALGVWLGSLGMLASLNGFVDPFCAYSGRESLFAPYKQGYERPEIKAEQVASLQPATLILGSSRALIFDPQWDEWGSLKTYNLAVAGATEKHVAAAFAYAVQTSRIERVLLCVEYTQFCERPGEDIFQRSRFSDSFAPVTYHGQNLLSQDAFDASVQTVRNYFIDRTGGFTPLGNARGGRFNLNGTPHHRFVATIRESGKLGGRVRTDDYRDALRQVVRGCRERNIELTVVVSPMHCLYLESLATQGLWEDYERWFGEVATIVETESRGEATLWNFAGYNRYTTEPAPLTNASPEPTYYQEASHFTGDLARKVFERVYDLPGADLEFGSRVQASDVSQQLAALNVERRRWLATRPESLALLREAFPTQTAARSLPELPAANDGRTLR